MRSWTARRAARSWIPLKFEKGRLRELGLFNEHDLYELVTNADERGGSHINAKWLQRSTRVMGSYADWQQHK